MAKRRFMITDHWQIFSESRVGVDRGFRAVGLERTLSCNIWGWAGKTVTQGQQITTLVVTGYEK